MKNLLTKFLPNLLPAATAFLNPWVLVAVLVYGGGMMFYGVHLEAGKLEAFQAKVTAAGEMQNARAAARIIADKALKKETDDAYKTKAGKLTVDNADLIKRVQGSARGSYVSAGQQPTGSKCPDGQACFDAAQFDEAVRVGDRGTQKFAEATAGLVGEGETVKLKLDTAIGWVAEQKRKR